MSKDLRNIFTKKEKLYSKMLLNPSPANKQKYNEIRNLAKRKRDEAENSYYFNKIDSDKTNLKHLWDLAGTIINPNKIKSKNSIKTLTINNKQISDDQAIADAMNDFFSSVGKNLASKVSGEKGTFKKFLRNRNPHSMELKEASDEEVYKIIMSLNGNKSCGDDGIRPSHLKHCVSSLKTL